MTRTIIIACALLLSSAAHSGTKITITKRPVAPWLAAAAVQEARWEVACILKWSTLRDKQLACLADAVRLRELQRIIEGNKS
jgi:hypothetical protein